ncbi:hypothetical protein AB0I72_27340 [Nocardiopsis sp. NPDC049922]|uniref:hypothetical protein n=1 Tax=Nocardiopsis sp. NPDC049922 TaxID=3155157 RepID=UPI0033F5CE52
MSGRASKARGYRYEADLEKFGRSWFPRLKRLGSQGQNDKSDFSGVRDWALEAKDRSPIRLSEWLREAEREAANAGKPWYAVLVKQRGKNVSHSYFVMTITLGFNLIKEHQQMQSKLKELGYEPSDWANT